MLPSSPNEMQLLLMLLLMLTLLLTLQPASGQCTICTDGSSVTRPNKNVIVPGFGDEIDCATAETLAPILVEAGTNECRVIHSLSTICGCPVPENACHLCGDAKISIRISDSDVDTRLLPGYSDLFNEAPSCELMEAYLHSVPANDAYCYNVQQDIAIECGCPAIENEFNKTTANLTKTNITNTTFDPPSLTLRGISFGTFGEVKPAHFVTRRRVALTSASLSVFGALLVITDNLWAFQKLKRNVYNQIIISMAIVDALVAISALFGNSAASTEDDYILPGEAGNDATCRAQGWFFQFGSISSLLLNASLSTYFLVVIVYNFRATTLKRIIKYLIGVPIFVGLILAFAALPYYTNALLGCHLSPPAGSAERLAALDLLPDSWGPILGFFFIPAWLVVAYTTGTLFRTYYHVSRVYRRGNRWRISTNIRALRRSFSRRQQTNDGNTEEPTQSASASASEPKPSRRGVKSSVTRRQEKSKTATRVNRVQDEVFWQCASYLLSLYLAWFTYLVITIAFEKFIIGYRALWLFVTFLYPLQPFLNCLVYFRPRVSRYIYRRRDGWMDKLYRLLQRLRYCCCCCCKSRSDDDDNEAAGSERQQQRRRGTNSDEMEAIAFQQACMEPAADLVELKQSAANTSVEDVVQDQQDEESGDEDGRDEDGGDKNDDDHNNDHDVEEASHPQPRFG